MYAQYRITLKIGCSYPYGYGVCSVSKRRKKAASEREAEIAIGVIFRVIIAAFGALLALIALTHYFSRRRTTDDLLEPVKKQSDLSYAFSRLPQTTKYAIGAFLVLLPFAIGATYYNPKVPPGILNHVFSLIFVLTVMCPIVALVSYWLYKRSHRSFRLVTHDPERFETLFRDGEAVYYDEDNYENFTTYTIRVPRGMEWNAERSTRFIEQLIHSFAPLLFRVYADDRAIIWQVVDILARDSEPIENAIRIGYPEADVHVGRPQDILDKSEPFYRLTLLYRIPNTFVFPIKHASDVKDLDPLTTVISALNGLRAGERIVYNVFVAGASPNAHEVGQKLISRSTITPFDYFSGQGLQWIATANSLNLDTVPKYVPEDQSLAEDKLKNPLYQALFLVQVDSPVQERLLPLAQNVDSQLYGFSRAPYNGLLWYTGIEEGDERVAPDPDTLIQKIRPRGASRNSAIRRIIELSEELNERDTRKATKLILGSRELGLLWHLPDEHFVASRISWLSSRTVPPPTAVIHQDSDYSVQLGHGTQGGRLYPIHLPIKDREKHVRIVGKTGVGKSSLLYDLIMQDIRIGFGVAVIDPHGSLVQSILETELTERQRERIVLIDLSDKVTPPPLNPLRGGLGQVRVGQIVQSIERIYPETKRLARTSRLLRVALLTLNADPQATLKDVIRLFSEAEYRERLIATLTDNELREEWEQFEQMTPSQRRDAIEPLRSRMSPFYSNPDLTDMMCHPDSLDFRSLIQDRNIILISLKMDEERVPETERDLIGALLLTRLQMSGMYAPDSYPYFVYIDEVQRFVTSSLEDMFSEARKFGLSLTVAHQFLEQLPDTTQNAIMGNAGASIIFACSPDDARVFQSYTRPYFEVDDIVNLDQFTAVVKMQCDGVSQPAFTLLTPLPQVEYREDLEHIPMFRRRVELDPTLLETQAFRSRSVRVRDAAHVRETSRQFYTPKRREDVHVWLRERYGRTIKLDDQTQFFDVDTAAEVVKDDTPSSVRNIDHIEGSGTVAALDD